MRIILLAVLLSLVSSIARADDWYFIVDDALPPAGGCKSDSPAAYIEFIREAGRSYKVINEKVDSKGKPVQVTVTINGPQSGTSSMTFYFGIERCEEAYKPIKLKLEKQKKEVYK